MSEKKISVNESLKSNYDSYYNEGVSAWRALGAKHKARNILSLCSSIPHDKIVDIGAGEGSVSIELSEQRFSSNICCLDISDSGVEVIKKRKIPGVVRVDKFDGYSIPYPDKYFDIGIASHVLEHVEHERLFLYEVARVSKYIFIEVPLEDTLRLPLNYKKSKLGHINFYNYKTIRQLLQTSGLDVLEQRLFDTPLDVHLFQEKRTGLPKFVIRRVLDFVNSQLAAKLFTYHCGILCRTSS